MATEIEVFVRDEALRRIAQIDDHSSLDIVLRFTDVGSWVLDLDPAVAMSKELLLGNGVEIVWDGSPLISGPLGTIDRDKSDRANTFTAAGPSDLVYLVDRLGAPRPLAPFTSEGQNVVSEADVDARSGPAESVIYEFVDANAGPAARPERQVPHLLLAEDLARGRPITGKARFQTLLEIAQDAAVANTFDFGPNILLYSAKGHSEQQQLSEPVDPPGPELGFEVRQIGQALEFRVLASPEDAGVFISEGLGNLGGFTVQRKRPGATLALMGGSTSEGSPRVLQTRTDPKGLAAFGRIERFVNVDASQDAFELDQAAQEVFAVGFSATIAPASVEGFAFRRDYDLGDRVTAIVDDQLISAVIREVAIHSDENGVTVTPLIGTIDATDDPKIFTDIRKTQAELSALVRFDRPRPA